MNDEYEVTPTDDSEYRNFPILPYKKVCLNGVIMFMQIIFCLSFGIFPIFMYYAMIKSGANSEDLWFMMIFTFIFGAVSIGSFFAFLKNLILYIIILIFGEQKDVIVVGYYPSGIVSNGKQLQVVQLRIDTNEGPSIIDYQLDIPGRPYAISDVLLIKIIKDKYILYKKSS